MAVSLSCCEVWRRNLSAGVYHFGADLWIYDDYGGDGIGTYDEKKSGGGLWSFRTYMDVSIWRMDQCDCSDADRSILFHNRWMGY